MKHLSTLLCIILIGFATSTMAQNTVNIPHETFSPGVVSIPVEVDFSAHPIGAFEIEISFDDAVVEFLGATHTSFGSFSIGTPTTDKVRLGRIGASSSFVGDLVLLNFQDKDGAGMSDLTFTVTTYDPGHIEPDEINPSWLADAGPPTAVVTTTFSDGSITFISPVSLSIWATILAFVLIAAFAVTRIYRIV